MPFNWIQEEITPWKPLEINEQPLNTHVNDHVLNMQEWIGHFFEMITWSSWEDTFSQNLFYKFDDRKQLLLPYRDYAEDISYISFKVSDYIHGSINAEHLRKSIVDYRLPDKDIYVAPQKWCLPANPWRYWNILLLSDIKYEKAIPELIEAWTYDYSDHFRFQCFKALGVMWEKAYKEAEKISKQLFDEESPYVKSQVAYALWEIWNPGVVYSIREALEEIIDSIRWDWKNVDTWKCIYLSELSRALFNIDVDAWLEFLHDLNLQEYNSIVDHHVWKGIAFNKNVHIRKRSVDIIYKPNASELYKYWK